MVDPLHRPQLLQSLCKVPYVKSEIIQQLMDETKMVQVKTEPIQVSYLHNPDISLKCHLI